MMDLPRVPPFDDFLAWLAARPDALFTIPDGSDPCETCGVACYLTGVNHRPVLVNGWTACFPLPYGGLPSFPRADLPQPYRRAIDIFDGLIFANGVRNTVAGGQWLRSIQWPPRRPAEPDEPREL